MTCARLVLLPQPSLAVQVRVIIFVQPTVLVTVVTLGVIGPWQASTKLGALKLGAVGHSIVASRPWSTVTAGAVVSITVMTCARLVLLPQPSLAVQVRVIIFLQTTVLGTVVTLGVIGPWQASTQLGALKLGAAGHSIVASRPWSTVTAGAVVSITVVTCARLV